MRLRATRFVRILSLALLIPRVATMQTGRTQALPAHALVAGVPFISWGDAARLDYQNKNILNPSIPASMAMMLEYWGGNRHQLAESFAAPSGWTTSGGVGGTMDSVRSYVARGIPIMVIAALTPIAHQVEPMAAAMATVVGSGQLTGGGNLTASQGRHVQDLVSEYAGFGSGVMGKMVAPDTLRHWGELLGQDISQETLFEAARVVIGYDDVRKVVILQDPSFGPAWEVSYDDFDTMWALMGRNFAVTYPSGSPQSAVRSGTGAYAERTPSQRAAETFVFGYALASTGRFAEAKTRLSAGLSSTAVPVGYRHLFLLKLGRVAASSGDTAEAITDYEQAGALIPEHHRPWLFLSRLYAGSSRAESRAKSADLQRRAAKLCRDAKTREAARRALPHDFTMMGCDGLLSPT